MTEEWYWWSALLSLTDCYATCLENGVLILKLKVSRSPVQSVQILVMVGQESLEKWEYPDWSGVLGHNVCLHFFGPRQYDSGCIFLIVISLQISKYRQQGGWIETVRKGNCWVGYWVMGHQLQSSESDITAGLYCLSSGLDSRPLCAQREQAVRQYSRLVQFLHQIELQTTKCRMQAASYAG